MLDYKFGCEDLCAIVIAASMLTTQTSANDRQYKLDLRFSYCNEALTNSEAFPISSEFKLPKTHHKDAQIKVCFDVPLDGGSPTNIKVRRNEAPELLDAALTTVKEFEYNPWVKAGKPTQRETLSVSFDYGPDPAAYVPGYKRYIAQRAQCKNTDSVLTIPTTCICKVGAYDLVPYFRNRYKLVDGYVGYASIEVVDSMRGRMPSNKSFVPIKLTGSCGNPDVCRNGEPVSGPINACLVASYWDEYAVEERENRTYGLKEGPTLFLQNLPKAD